MDRHKDVCISGIQYAESRTVQAYSVDELLQESSDIGFDGWLVVEQDRVLTDGGSLDQARISERRNRDFLRGRGL